jgi:hypothetical protein
VLEGIRPRRRRRRPTVPASIILCRRREKLLSGGDASGGDAVGRGTPDTRRRRPHSVAVASPLEEEGAVAGFIPRLDRRCFVPRPG